MNLILLFEQDLIGQNRVLLTGRRLRHVLSVHRAAVGDKLTVGLLNGPVGKGIITLLAEDRLEMEVDLQNTPPPPLPLTLLLALPRPKVLRRVLRTVTAMGVKKIFLINSSRVEKSYWQTPFLSDEVIREQSVLGLEQARDTVMSEVFLHKLFKPFVEDELPSLADNTLALVAHPVADAVCPREVTSPVTLAVGPEGGFIPYEIEKLEACGFRPVSLGERSLTVEAAVPALIGRLF